MRLFILALIAFLSAVPAGCRNRGAAAEEPQAVARCFEDINSIPGLAAALKARNKDENLSEARPLEGLELALTISDMVHSKGDAEEEIDDWCYSQNSRENFDKLVAALKRSNLPPTVSFVVGGELDRVLAEAWLGQGNLIGNMTYSRMKVRKQTAEQAIKDIAMSDEALAPFVKKFGQKQKYFRYPRLKPSRDAQGSQQIRTYLKQNGYVEVTATIEAQDNRFSVIYCEAQARDDTKCTSLVREYFKSLLLDTTLRSRAAAGRLAGREVKHILLLRANQLIIDNLGDLVAWYRAMGARFISVDEALRDPFYAVVDDEENSGPQAVVKEVIRAQKWEKQ